MAERDDGFWSACIGAVTFAIWAISLVTLVVTQYVVVPSIVLLVALMIWLGAGLHFIRLAVRTARDDGAGPSRATALGLRALVEYVFYFAP